MPLRTSHLPSFTQGQKRGKQPAAHGKFSCNTNLLCKQLKCNLKCNCWLLATGESNLVSLKQQVFLMSQNHNSHQIHSVHDSQMQTADDKTSPHQKAFWFNSDLNVITSTNHNMYIFEPPHHRNSVAIVACYPLKSERKFSSCSRQILWTLSKKLLILFSSGQHYSLHQA